MEIRPLEVRPLELRPFEVRPLEVRPLELRPFEVRPFEVRPSEVRPLELRPWRFAPWRFAPWRFAPWRFAPWRFALSRSTCWSAAPCSTASERCAKASKELLNLQLDIIAHSRLAAKRSQCHRYCAFTSIKPKQSRAGGFSAPIRCPWRRLIISPNSFPLVAANVLCFLVRRAIPFSTASNVSSLFRAHRHWALNDRGREVTSSIGMP